MHVRASSMGISFWPSFQFSPPQREPRMGSVQLSGAPASRQLHISFMPPGAEPDEFQVGATFLGGLPFPFLTIRTTKLEVSSSSVHRMLMASCRHSCTTPWRNLQALQSGGRMSPHRAVAATPAGRLVCPHAGHRRHGHRGGQPGIPSQVPGRCAECTLLQYLSQQPRKGYPPPPAFRPPQAKHALGMPACALNPAGIGAREPTELVIDTHLTTEAAEAHGVRMEGQRLQAGECTCVRPPSSACIHRILPCGMIAGSRPVPRAGAVAADCCRPVQTSASCPRRMAPTPWSAWAWLHRSSRVLVAALQAGGCLPGACDWQLVCRPHPLAPNGSYRAAAHAAGVPDGCSTSSCRRSQPAAAAASAEADRQQGRRRAEARPACRQRHPEPCSCHGSQYGSRRQGSSGC